MNRIIILGAIGLSLLASCKRPCSDHYLTPAFIGYSVSELDTLIIRRFKKDGNFFPVIDTAIITNNHYVASYNTSNDTTIVNVNVISGVYNYVSPDHDWQIYIPSRNQTISISNIVSPQNDMSCFGDCWCANPINSFLQNGQLTVPPYNHNTNYGSSYFMYIHQ